MGLVYEQEVGNVVGSLALLALVGPLQSISDSPRDFIPSGTNIQQIFLNNHYIGSTCIFT